MPSPTAETTIERTLSVPGVDGAVRVTVTDQGTGRPVLLLHGGGGPASVAPFATALAGSDRLPARVLTPVHPGFDGTDRPEALTTIAGLAATYAALLDDLGLGDVTVVGNSIGGWIAAELALLAPARVAAYALVDAVGIVVPGEPIADFFSLTLDQVAELAYCEPDRFRIDPSALPPVAQAGLAGNRDALATYAGAAMADPTLAGRLAAVTAPVAVIWGEADGIAGPDYGRALAAAIPGARFELLERTGHMPQLETPGALIDALAALAAV